MRASLEAFRAVFGKGCRFSINAVSDKPRRTVYVTAQWDCGCIGTGQSYERLTLLPCAEHFADAVTVADVRVR